MTQALRRICGFAVLATAALLGCREDPVAPHSSNGSIAFVTFGDPDGTGIPTLGGEDGEALGVNDAGVVVGSSDLADGQRHAFRWSQSGGLEDLFPAALQSTANDISAAGVIVGGIIETSNSTNHAFRLGPEGLEILPQLTAGQFAEARGVNAAGIAVGLARDGSFRNVAVMWDAQGGITTVVTPQARAEANDINDNGVVVGTSDQHAFRWTAVLGVQMLRLPVGATNSAAVAVNNAGYIAGHWGTPTGNPHGIVWSPDGSIIDLGPLAGIHPVTDMNEAGQVVGQADVAGMRRGFVWDSIEGSIQALPTTGGHHHDTGRPHGELSDTTVTTDSSGYATVTYFAPQPSGVVSVAGEEYRCERWLREPRNSGAGPAGVAGWCESRLHGIQRLASKPSLGNPRYGGSCKRPRGQPC